MCLGTFPHRARSSVTVCAFARYAHPDTRNISFSLNRICSEGNCQVLYRAATGVGFFSYVSPIGSGIMNLFPAVLIEYTKYFVKRIYSMSSKTKIIVLRMKEIIYTAHSFSSKCSFSVNTATLAVFGIPVDAAGAEAAAGAFPVMPERTCFTISSIFTLFMSIFFLPYFSDTRAKRANAF